MSPVAAPPVVSPTVSYARGVLLVLLAGVCWSSMGLAIRFIEIANVWQIVFYRSCALTPFLFTVIAIRSGGRPLNAIRRAGKAGVVGALGLVVAFTGGIFAIQTTTVANAMFLFATAPFVAALLGRLLLGESVRTATLVAAGVALVGTVMMVAEGVSLGYMRGNVAALVSALGFAVFTISLRWGRLEDMMPAVFLSGVFAILATGAVCLLSGQTLAVPANDMAIALSLGVLQVGAGLVIYTIGSRAVPAAELALLSMTEVVLGPFWVWLFLGETAGAYTLAGGAILMGAIAGNAVSGLRRKPTPVM